MTKDKALKLALEALETPWNAPYVDGCDLALGKKVKAITAIKEALAQPEQECNCSQGQCCRVCDPDVANGFEQPKQEPVAWVDLLKEAQQIVESKVLWKRFIDGTPLSNDIACWMAAFAQQHPTPPQRTWVGLTEDEADKIYKDGNTFGEMMRMVEAKLKEKNT